MFNWFSSIGKARKSEIPVHSPSGYAEQDNSGEWLQYFAQYLGWGSLNEVKKYKRSDAYKLANCLAEVYIPVDMIAERTAQPEYELFDKRTKNVYEPSGNLAAKWSKPNPTKSINELVYDMTFNSLVEGEVLGYTKIPDSYRNATIENITNVWVLDPSVTSVKLKKQVANPFTIRDLSEIIDKYVTFFLFKHEIDPRYVYVRNSGGFDSNFRAKSPLDKAERNINNLLAVYEARFNAYQKNGMAGILTRDSKNMNTLESSVNPITRKQIIDDLKARNGITGGKNFWNVSSVPLKFLKTLGTIQELQPFVESETDMIVIAGLFGINKHLLPIKEGTTFTNQQDAEKGLWQNVIKGLCYDRAQDLEKMFKLPDGIGVRPVFDKIEILQEDKKTSYEADGILLDNLQKLKDAGEDVSAAYSDLTDKYNGQ